MDDNFIAHGVWGHRVRMSCTVGYLLLSTFLSVVPNRLKGKGAIRSESQRKKRDAATRERYEVVPVRRTHQHEKRIYGFWESEEEMAEFLRKYGSDHTPINIHGSSIVTYTVAAQVDLYRSGCLGYMFVDVETDMLVHKHDFTPFGTGPNVKKTTRESTVADCARAQEIHNPQARSSDDLGHCVCAGWTTSYAKDAYEYKSYYPEHLQLLQLAWRIRFYAVTLGLIFRAAVVGMEEYFFCASTVMKKIGFPTIAGKVYSAVGIFCDDERGMGYAPKCHRDQKDAFLCAILNCLGKGWMTYPEYNISIEFTDWTTWLFDPHAWHCCL